MIGLLVDAPVIITTGCRFRHSKPCVQSKENEVGIGRERRGAPRRGSHHSSLCLLQVATMLPKQNSMNNAREDMVGAEFNKYLLLKIWQNVAGGRE